jgi:RNA polymerase sigma-70 factor (ECF subfamily)
MVTSLSYGEGSFAARNHEEDSWLVEAARGGDKGAFDRLYSKYFDLVHRLAGRFGIADWNTREDIAQTAFLRVYTHLPKFETVSRGGFANWLYTIVHNLANDEFLRRESKSAGPLEFDVPDMRGDDILRAVEGEDLKSRLEAAISGLSAEEEEGLAYAMSGRPYKEIALSEGIPLGTVKSRICRAKEAMHRNLGKTPAVPRQRAFSLSTFTQETTDMQDIPDPHLFKVTKARAYLGGNGELTVRLWYPHEPEIVKERPPADPEYGIRVLGELLEKGDAEIADPQHPLCPASGGVIDVLNDGRIVVHRNGDRAAAYARHFGLAAGSPSNDNDTVQVPMLAYRKGAEEHIFTARADPRQLLIMKHSYARDFALQSAKRLGLDVSRQNLREVCMSYRNGPDMLEIFDDYDRRRVFHYGHIGLSWGGEAAAVNFLLERIWECDPRNVLPYDAQGREVFILKPEELRGVKEGDRLEKPEVYKTALTPNGPIAELQAAEPADAPYIFKPDEKLFRMLHGMGIWPGSWIDGEIAREKRTLAK